MISVDQSVWFLIILLISVVALFITRWLMKTSFPYVFIGIVGLVLGLLVGALLSIPLSRLPGDYGKWLPMIINVFAAVAVLDLFLGQAKGFSRYFNRVATGQADVAGFDFNLLPEVIADTSVLVDGRITEMASTGFMVLPIAIPAFVIDELHALADSKDSLKRVKGNRGLEVLEALRQNGKISLRIIDKEIRGKSGVDLKLIVLAKERGSRLITTDVALSRSASIQGVAVLNINELANSLKPMVYPGELIELSVVQKGKSKGQGIGYLIDGSMVVVEGGERLVNKTIKCRVDRIFQTATGRMLFAVPE
jgi:uncharacterized protein YacL